MRVSLDFTGISFNSEIVEPLFAKCSFAYLSLSSTDEISMKSTINEIANHGFCLPEAFQKHKS